MVPKEFLLIAGDAEGDRLAAALVPALCQELTSAETGYEEGLQPLHASLEPRFYGAGGRQMAEAGVELFYRIEDLQAAGSHTIRRLLFFRRVFGRMYQRALDREPHVIAGIGFFGFNLRFAHAIKRYVRHRQETFYNWDPLLVQFGLPSDWTSRARRAQRLDDDIDLFLGTGSPGEIDPPSASPSLRAKVLGQIKGPSEVPDLAQHAAQAIVQRLLECEARFPLRAYLAAD